VDIHLSSLNYSFGAGVEVRGSQQAVPSVEIPAPGSFGELSFCGDTRIGFLWNHKTAGRGCKRLGTSARSRATPRP
jgi:hypothetical protein